MSSIFSAGYLTIFGVGIAYVAGIALLHPEYFKDIIPMARYAYSAHQNPAENVIGAMMLPSILASIVFIPAILKSVDGIGVFALATFAGFTSYWVGHTGIGYHQITLLTYILLGAGWFLLSAGSVSMALVPSAVTLTVLLQSFFQQGLYNSRATNHVVYNAHLIGPFNSIMVGSTRVDPGAPAALRLGVDWVSRYPASWSYSGVTGLLDQSDCVVDRALCEELRAVIETNREDNLQDILKYEPDLIATDRIVDLHEVGVLSWMEFMKKDPRFVEAMENYTLVKTTNRMEFYLRNQD